MEQVTGGAAPHIPPAAQEKVKQWLSTACPAAPCRPSSPTRAPSGWSLSLSVSRAKRALEEEQKAAAAEAEHAEQAELEDGEVPATPPPATPLPATPPPAASEECQLKAVALEQQVASLRQANARLQQRLKDHEDAHLKTSSSLRAMNEDLERRVKAYKSLEKAQGKVIAELQQEKETISARLLKVKSKDAENDQIVVKHLRAEVAKLKTKVENQKVNLTGLQAKLMKVAPAEPTVFKKVYVLPESPRSSSCEKGCSSACRQKVEELEALVTRHRNRLKNQANQLSQLAAALKKQRTDMCSVEPRPTSTRELRLERSAPGSSHQAAPERSGLLQPHTPAAEAPGKPFGCASLSDWLEGNDLGQESMKVIVRASPVADIVVKHYEALGLPALHPALKAALANMPPATRSLCLSQLGQLGQPAAAKTELQEVRAPALPCPLRNPLSGEARSASAVAGPAPRPPVHVKQEGAPAGIIIKSYLVLPAAPPVFGPKLPPALASLDQRKEPDKETADFTIKVKTEKGLAPALPGVADGGAEGTGPRAQAMPAPPAPSPSHPAWVPPSTVSYPQYLYDGLKYSAPPPSARPDAESVAGSVAGSVAAGSMLPPPPAAIPLRLPRPPAAVPLGAKSETKGGEAPRKRGRGATDAGPEEQEIRKRNAMASLELQVMKKRILQHLQLEQKK